jgi:hypothetical protein
MQFVLIVFQGTTPTPASSEWATLSDSEQQSIYADYAAVNARAEVTPGLPLGLPGQARTVTVVAGHTNVADGTYLGDPATAAAGYSIVEADDIDIAIEIASMIPAARLGGAIEIRPVATYW